MNLNFDVEPAHEVLINRRIKIRKKPAYSARKTSDVNDDLQRFFVSKEPGSTVGGVQRMGGGASKEQFLFTLAKDDDEPVKYVLRMDPQCAITETDRRREFEILEAMQGVVPVPEPVWIDEHGDTFGQPAIIMKFVGGVTKPSDSDLKVSGLGTYLGEWLREKLKGQFLDCLVAVHGVDLDSVNLPGFQIPNSDPYQAARWSLNYWNALWDIDSVEERPIFSYARQWLQDNLPACEELVITHGDYRTGNYLFDEDSGKITSVLDWEFARIGDFHEDLSWVLMQVFGTNENGVFRASDLYARAEFIEAYEKTTGRTVNLETLHFYDVLASYKCYIIVNANGLAAARAEHNHQDVLLTFLSSTQSMFCDDLCRLLSKGN